MQTSAVLSPRSKNVVSCSCSEYIKLTECVFRHIEAQSRIEIGIYAARFLNQIDAASDPPFAGSEQSGRLFADQFLLVGAENRLIECHPAKWRAGFNDFVEAAVLAFADRDRFLGTQVVTHDFGEKLAAAVHFWRKTLADDVAKRVGQPNSQLLFFA